MPIYFVSFDPLVKKYDVKFISSGFTNRPTLDSLLITTKGNLAAYTEEDAYSSALEKVSRLITSYLAAANTPSVSAETKALRDTLDVLVNYMHADVNDREAADILEKIRGTI